MFFFFFSSLFSVGDAQPQPCFLKCKDNYMHNMQSEMSDTSSEWTTEMVTPLQALLMSYNQKGLLDRKVDRICKLNTVYDKCLRSCPENPAKRILMSGQQSWNIICEHYANDTEFRVFVIPCWSDNGPRIAGKCVENARFLQAEIVTMMESGVENIQEGISNLCKSVHSYDKCFVWENYETCGINAGKFLMTLTHQTSHALIEMLDGVLGVQKLPKTCKDWLNQKGLRTLTYLLGYQKGHRRRCHRYSTHSCSTKKTKE